MDPENIDELKLQAKNVGSQCLQLLDKLPLPLAYETISSMKRAYETSLLAVIERLAKDDPATYGEVAKTYRKLLTSGEVIPEEQLNRVLANVEARVNKSA